MNLLYISWPPSWLKNMQNAANSSVLVPLLLEQIFQRFSRIEDETDKENFFLDLHKLFGARLVPAALNILDHHNIVIYTNCTKTIQIAEIYDIRYPVRFFLHINYCTCEYFQSRVLIKESSSTDPYTCQHLLAGRLAIALQHRNLCFKEVSTYDLDLLLASLVHSSLPEE